MNINVWYAHTLLPGTDQEREHAYQIQTANIILFFVSADFITSYEHNKKEIRPAMERQKRGEAYVIPIILRPVDWQGTEFGHLYPLPDNNLTITDTHWKTPDHAYFAVFNGIKHFIIEQGLYPPDNQADTDKDAHRGPDLAESRSHDAQRELENIIQNFTALRSQITNFVYLKGPKNFSLESCESQYNKLYGDTLMFLAVYLPERISDSPEGFIETVLRHTQTQLHSRNSISVSIARMLIPYLEKLERIAEQIDACVATLKLYKQEDMG